MGNDSVLPKNIRQIGDVRGRQKICVEDYVMTYVRKKEAEEEKGFLGIFLGEKKKMEDSDYIFIRGILEITEDVQITDTAADWTEKTDAKKDTASKEESSAKDKWRKYTKDKINKKAEQIITGHAEQDTNNSGTEITENKENKEDKKNTEDTAAGKRTEILPSDSLSEKIQRERRLYFPDWEVQGCCVIGTYPAERMEQLAEAIPESVSFLYHLQEQEENLYSLQEGQYQRVRGYFVFYEQNRLMQEYISEVFGENSVEKETLPDRAIKSFREKVARKSETKSRNMLRLAGSFFIVTMLVIGTIVVNRVEDIRDIQNLPELPDSSVFQEKAGNSIYQELSDSSVFQEKADNSTQQNMDIPSDTDTLSVAVSRNPADSISNTTPITASTVNSPDTASITASTVNSSDTAPITASTVNSSDTASITASTVNSSDTASITTSTANSSDTASINPDTDVFTDSASVNNTAAVSSDTVFIEDTPEYTPDTMQSDRTISEESVSVSAASMSADRTSQSSAAAELSGADSFWEEDSEEVSAIRQIYASYVIKEGDTLADICNKYYGNLNRLQEICEANEIEDANRIMPGQKIILP